MSWWDSSQVESHIMRATSSSIPSGEQDLALNLEISDLVRSKEADPKTTLRVLRKRLYDPNPNVQVLTLHLLDLLVKNGGNHFLVELTSNEFITAYVTQFLTLQNQNRNPEVVQLMLEYFQMWALASGTKPEAKFLREKYEELKKRKDIEFPDYVDNATELSSSFLESATAPEWTDSDLCMKSGQPFTFYNRKHHCRNCGGVFLQEYCSSFRPLPHYGINIPVRVCVDCNARLEQKYRNLKSGSSVANKLSINSPQNSATRTFSSNNADIGSKYREDLAQAINMSLNASKNANNSTKSASNTFSSHRDTAIQNASSEDDMDDDMKRAIAASLADMQSHSSLTAPAPFAPAQSASDSGTAGYAPNYPRYPQEPASGPTVAFTNPEPKIEPALPPKEKQSLDNYISLVQTSTPYDAVYNQNLTGLNQDAIRLQPKIITELRSSTEKLSVLEDLHGKLLAISSYYDRLLDAELSSDLGNMAMSEEPPATAFAPLPPSQPTETNSFEAVNSHENHARSVYEPTAAENAPFGHHPANTIAQNHEHESDPSSAQFAQSATEPPQSRELPLSDTSETQVEQQPSTLSETASESVATSEPKPSMENTKPSSSQIPPQESARNALQDLDKAPKTQKLPTAPKFMPNSPIPSKHRQDPDPKPELESESEPESESQSESESENEPILIEL